MDFTLRLRGAKHVRLHLKGVDRSYEGFLVSGHNGHYRLLRAHTIEPGGATHSLDGEAWVPKSNVEVVQVLP